MKSTSPPPTAGPAPGLTRREFGRRLAGATLTATALSIGWSRSVSATDHDAPHASTLPLPLPTSLLDGKLLDASPFAYISPLRANGRESTCHAELWYAWLDDAVVVTVARDRWKAGALARGLDRARIWVGDHGRWKTWYGGRNEAFRSAPNFEARVEQATDPKLVERLLSVYEIKYPDEVADWRDIMRQGSADGSRVVLRYTPNPAGTRA